MKQLMPFDEVNRLNEELMFTTYTADDGTVRSRRDKRDVIDEIWDLLIMSYLYGNEAVNDAFGFNIEPNYDVITDGLNKSIGGKTTKERLDEHYDSGDFEGIKKVVETESHRMYNRGVIDTATDATKQNPDVTLMKRWVTMLDDRVRDTHDFLEGVRIPLDEFFVTSDGDSAYAPGDFELPENNINCRCLLDIVTA